MAFLLSRARVCNSAPQRTVHSAAHPVRTSGRDLPRHRSSGGTAGDPGPIAADSRHLPAGAAFGSMARHSHGIAPGLRPVGPRADGLWPHGLRSPRMSAGKGLRPTGAGTSQGREGPERGRATKKLPCAKENITTTWNMGGKADADTLISGTTAPSRFIANKFKEICLEFPHLKIYEESHLSSRQSHYVLPTPKTSARKLLVNRGRRGSNWTKKSPWPQGRAGGSSARAVHRGAQPPRGPASWGRPDD